MLATGLLAFSALTLFILAWAFLRKTSRQGRNWLVDELLAAFAGGCIALGIILLISAAFTLCP